MNFMGLMQSADNYIGKLSAIDPIHRKRIYQYKLHSELCLHT